MQGSGRSRWGTLLALIVLVLIAAGAMWYRLAREGHVPLPGRWVVFGGLLLLALLPFGFMVLYRALARETEDAAVLSQRVREYGVPATVPRDYTRDYPLVFRPEWRGIAMNTGMTVMTVIVAILQADRMSLRDQLLAFTLLVGLATMLISILMSRRLTISWAGVTLKEVRRVRFWSWDEISAVVLWERRGRRRPALRLRTLQGAGELVSLGGIDFANEELLFDALLARVQRVQVQVGDRTIALRPDAGEDVRAAIEVLLGQEWQAETPLPETLSGAAGKKNGAGSPQAHQYTRSSTMARDSGVRH